MHNTYSYEETDKDLQNKSLESQRNYQQLRQFARLFLHIGLLPLAYALWFVLSENPNMPFMGSESFNMFFWFLCCAFVILVSQRQRRYIKDSGLRTFYMLAVTAVSLMLALNMTGLLT